MTTKFQACTNLLIDRSFNVLLFTVGVLIVLRGYAAALEFFFSEVIMAFKDVMAGKITPYLFTSAHLNCVLMLASFTLIYASLVALASKKIAV
ncbi:hypothetical protein ACRZ5S_22550 (plasmid) [Vibrio scophthalmi]|uniref:hypothetical protein n=1 Tax=Vibrio scophthalmi TaxID=45658 RepID=UPI003EB97CA7